MISRFARFLFLSFTLAGCGGSTGLPEVSYPVEGRGEAAEPFLVEGWTVTLGSVRVAFGPAYFCATAAASSDLCRVALSELALVAMIDGLNPVAQPLGEAKGQSGTARSATYDLGISWFTTQRQPTPASTVPTGHSALFEGQAVKGAQTVRFTAAVDVVPSFQDTRVVQGQPISVTLKEGLKLTVGLSPSTWWRAVDFDALAALGGDPVAIFSGSQAYEALVFGMVTGRPPSLHWSRM